MTKTSIGILTALFAPAVLAQAAPELKQATLAGVDRRAKLVQEMVDSIYSFAEPGFQEFRTSEYITGILEKNGFTIERGVAGIPTAWTAKWGKSGPTIALGSDIDALLGLSQVPGSPTVTPQVLGAPGHGEGHNSGMPAVVAAALSVKEVMEKNKIQGRLMIWPGVAEELLGTKAFYVRAGMFKDVDASIFTHVSKDLSTYLQGIAEWFVCEGAPGLSSEDLTSWLQCFFDEEYNVFDQETFLYEETEYVVSGVWPGRYASHEAETQVAVLNESERRLLSLEEVRS